MDSGFRRSDGSTPKPPERKHYHSVISSIPCPIANVKCRLQNAIPRGARNPGAAPYISAPLPSPAARIAMLLPQWRFCARPGKQPAALPGVAIRGLGADAPGKTRRYCPYRRPVTDGSAASCRRMVVASSSSSPSAATTAASRARRTGSASICGSGSRMSLA